MRHAKTPKNAQRMPNRRHVPEMWMVRFIPRHTPSGIHFFHICTRKITLASLRSNCTTVGDRASWISELSDSNLRQSTAKTRELKKTESTLETDMNSIFRKIVFHLKKVECYVYGIDSLGVTNSVKTLIYKNGDEYSFDGFSESNRFHLAKDSITIKRGSPDLREIDTVENDLIEALRQYGFVEIICKPSDGVNAVGKGMR